MHSQLVRTTDHSRAARFDDDPGVVEADHQITLAASGRLNVTVEDTEEVARTIYAPVSRAHRCELEHIAIMEPAMSETVGATLCLALREATDEAVRRGVPREAAMDFMLGHIQIELAIAFGIFKEGKFSDGALHAIREARPLIFKDNWLEAVFSPEAVMASVKDICNPKQAA